MRLLAARALLLCAAVLCAAASPAAADPHLPPAGKVWHGVASGASIGDFQARTGRRPAVWQQWLVWNGSFEYAFDRAEQAGTRLMLHLSTASGQGQPERLSPGDIARGRGDSFLLRLAARIEQSGSPVYVRLMAEMNNCDNAYASHHCSGARRDADHTPARFKQAWRRVVTIMRGGARDAVDRRLRAMRLPGVQGPLASEELPRPQVAFLWSPMTGGSPMIAALRPERFWPGSRWVDWVSTSFYSRFPNFHFLEPYYRRFAVGYRKPFAFGEWAMWGGDSGAFAQRLFAWVRSHRRVRMMVYNQGEKTAGPFRLARYPAAQRAIRQAVRAPAFRLPVR